MWRAVEILLTQKPHDICVVELFHAGRLAEKILHLWASADGNWRWDRAHRKRTCIICRWTKFERCCLNFEEVASLVVLPYWYAAAETCKNPLFFKLFGRFMEMAWPWNDTPLQWTLYVPIFYTSRVFISSLNKKTKLLALKLVSLWPRGGGVWPSVKQPVSPNVKGLIVTTSAVYSLFIVLTATLRTDSSWVSSPSITEPNSPEETN